MTPPVPAPAPPVGATVDPAVGSTVTTVMAVLAAAALVFSLVHWKRSGRPTVPVLLLAGGAMMLLEPFVDAVGGCWHPADLARAFTLWGRPMPVWLCLTYFVYFGVGGGLSWMMVRRRATPGLLWGLFLAGMAGDLVLEVVLLHWDTYVYYGAQPLVLWKFPLWWAAVNSLVNVAVAVAVTRLERSLAGARVVLVVPLAMAVSAAVNTVAGWPSWTAVNSGFTGPAGALWGAGSFAVAFALMHLMVTGRWWLAPGAPASRGAASARARRDSVAAG